MADSQVYVRTIEVFFNVSMEIKKDFCLLPVPRMQRTIQPQVMTSSGLFILVWIDLCPLYREKVFYEIEIQALAANFTRG